MRLCIGLGIAVFSIVFVLATQGVGAGPVEPKTTPSSPTMAAGAGDLLGFMNPSAPGGQQITLVNASRGTMLVYHISSESGQITLQSSRRLTWDFSLDEYNATAPLPSEIRQMVER